MSLRNRAREIAHEVYEKVARHSDQFPSETDYVLAGMSAALERAGEIIGRAERQSEAVVNIQRLTKELEEK